MENTTAGITINSQLRKLAAEDPEKPAFIIWDKDLNRTVLTRQDVWDKSRKCAAFLQRHGVVKGDVVCNTLANSQERLITTYGTLLAGAISMNGQKLLSDGQDIMNNWKQSRCKVVIVNPDEKRGAADILEKIKNTNSDITGTVKYKGLPHLCHVIPIDLGCGEHTDNTNGQRTSWLELLEQETEVYDDVTVCEDDIAFIFTTSGSTGFAKLVVHTHKTIFANEEAENTFINLTQNSVVLNVALLGWIGGAPTRYPFLGMTRVFIDYTREKLPSDQIGEFLIRILEAEKCEWMYIIPSDVDLMLKCLDAEGKHRMKHTLRTSVTGGGPVSVENMKGIGRIVDSCNAQYAGTEIGRVAFLKVTDPSTYQNTCVGNVNDSAEIKILDENGKDVGIGVSGEIYIRSPTLAKGYYNNEEATKEYFSADGWFRTSDIGHVNEKGHLFVYCRMSHAINHKGYIHYPGWMEARIDEHPDIQKCILVGVPNPVNYEDVCCCLVKTQGSNLTPSDVEEYCKALFLTAHTDSITPMPRYYLFFDSFPRNENGKIKKSTLKEMALTRLARKTD